VCLCFTDRLTAKDGEEIYRNSGTIVFRLAWGRVVGHEVNEDTESPPSWTTTCVRLDARLGGLPAAGGRA
jgi:hypothetical protein